ncbi:uncharacterized protein LOC123712815 [Pieris brassicae]|uniref:uncharacterized protein LOC123712815 n=1 Tax=Pieris brassicae TaxID=7116 RepID=UPI001E6604CF|nr:uncharacterized protein LOC123712815 [Pieris brassicae]
MARRVRVRKDLSKKQKDVGRLVDTGQADDRRLIRLVQARPVLYARNNMPVASYYTSVKRQWQEVAQEMDWTVAEVRRKWSHIRNSYSRHLRNEMHGACTSRGRMVSKWYLADDLEFLRDHMATDARSVPYPSFAPTLLDLDSADDAHDVKPLLSPAWFMTPPLAPRASSDDGCGSAFGSEESSSYFQFFRGLHADYQMLCGSRQRAFQRRCLAVLHELLDERDSVRPPPVSDDESEAKAPEVEPTDYTSTTYDDTSEAEADPFEVRNTSH